jgi:hypothetical protein
MGDPFGMRDDDCWTCIVRELRKSNDADAANGIQDALDDPFPNRALSLFETLNSHHRMAIDAAAQTCQLEGTCQW